MIPDEELEAVAIIVEGVEVGVVVPDELPHGVGVLFRADGSVYLGQWADGVPQADGAELCPAAPCEGGR